MFVSRVIVSIQTKFSILIGSPRAYLSRNRFSLVFVIGHLFHSHVNYLRSDGFLFDVSYGVLNLWKALLTFSLKGSSKTTFFNLDTLTYDTVTDMIN